MYMKSIVTRKVRRLATDGRAAFAVVVRTLKERFFSSMNEDFDEHVAAQFAAFMLILAGGEMNKTVMSKFLYIADRENVRRYGTPLFNDSHVALKNGPICQNAVDGLNGKKHKQVFAKYLTRDGDALFLAERLAPSDFGRMSDSKYNLARELWREHGHLSRAEIIELTHGDAFPEWREGCERFSLTTKSLEISDEAFAKAAGVEPSSYTQARADARNYKMMRPAYAR